jgi:hypothetical protein
MKKFREIVAAVAFFGLTTMAIAQAPIVRQPPTDPNLGMQTGADQQAPPQAQPQYDQQGQAQPQAQPMPLQSPQQLDQLVGRIALYPDPLLAQTLTAATYWDEIPEAARWADEHAYIHGDALSAAMQADNLPWDPSVLALLPFPSVLDMMARDPDWTGRLGNAVLSQRPDVMDAVQRLRREARGYGYLASNSDVDVIDDGGYIEIQPFNPYLYYVPIYDPLIVYGPPRPGLFVGGVIRFGPAVTLGVSFGRLGWFGAGFGWRDHAVLIDHRPWVRTYQNRAVYAHPYAHPYVRPIAPQQERHPAPARGGRDRR